jgi:serine/threonine/tyrosine-interacting protein
MDLWEGRSHVQEVASRVFITNVFGSRKVELLEQCGITHVLVCAAELPFAFPGRFHYERLDLADNTHCALPLHDAMAFILRALGDSSNRVLLYCAAGSSRSGAVAVAYKMISENLIFKDALERAQGIRQLILPNPGFVEQLEVNCLFFFSSFVKTKFLQVFEKRRVIGVTDRLVIRNLIPSQDGDFIARF